MDCPVCGNAMVTLELADVEIDHCLHCGGIWLDAGELELLMNDPLKARKLIDSLREEPSAAEKARKCPICDRRMAKVAVSQSGAALLIDKCRRGDGLWFDRGELQDILDRAQLDKDNRIRRLLADMFGKDRRDKELAREL